MILADVFFSAWSYQVSYLEFFGMITGIVAIGLSAQANVWNWPIGIVNVVLSFFLFYSVQLYPDMFLQVFFFVTNLIGWWRWTHPRPEEATRKQELRVSRMNMLDIAIVVSTGMIGTLVLGTFAKKLHDIFPVVFTEPSAFPYSDSFITVMSIVTTYYVIQKKLECWIIWIVVDLLAAYLYMMREIYLYSFLYLIFTGIAIAGFRKWRIDLLNDAEQRISI